MRALAAALLLGSAAAGAQEAPRRQRVPVEAPSGVARGGPADGAPVAADGAATAPEDAASIPPAAGGAGGAPAELDLSVLQSPSVPSEAAEASFDAQLGAAALHDPPAEGAPPEGAAPRPAPARRAARPSAPRGDPKRMMAAAGGAAALAFFLLPLWRRLNIQEVSVTPYRAPGRAAPAAPPDLLAEAEAAALLAGRYERRRLIGRGGMAQVWEAVDRSTGRVRAVKKIIIPEGPRAESRRRLALLEARTLTTLRHPNVVEFIEVLDLPEGLFLVFEFLHGKTLAQILAERKRLPWPQLKLILAPVCVALQYAHQRGFVHRDLKPANVMVLPDGAVKVMDLGIARALSEGDQAVDFVADAPVSPQRALLARTSNLVGTPGYRPPEAEKGVVSVAFDVFSLGAVVYEALVGEMPPRAGAGSVPVVKRRLAERAADVPQGVRDWVASALEPELGRRPGSIDGFVGQTLKM